MKLDTFGKCKCKEKASLWVIVRDDKDDQVVKCFRCGILYPSPSDVISEALEKVKTVIDCRDRNEYFTDGYMGGGYLQTLGIQTLGKSEVKIVKYFEELKQILEKWEVQ